MGTIIVRKRKDDSLGYHAQVAVQTDGQAHRETKTFDRRPAAAAWIKRREAELEGSGALTRAKIGDPALGAVIDRYVAESRRTPGEAKAQVLRSPSRRRSPEPSSLFGGQNGARDECEAQRHFSHRVVELRGLQRLGLGLEGFGPRHEARRAIRQEVESEARAVGLGDHVRGQDGSGCDRGEVGHAHEAVTDAVHA
ncbi:hypothetical protein [Methylobacterium radiodurans]|uniref:Integrase n=1 Tax=Methylobacterium radiodurans TaxID=2202828 RepID=A0A2U8VSD1_9HYPH|nr:hypothetical protein [Methylobacterium radiodurans]AWN36378.1 hypothetical protein DK427_12100 [Methylobacterium radiodurans]